MRYAVISDIHGNLEAFKAVLQALSEDRIDGFYSLGDIVGYGADPSAAIKLLRSLDPKASIAGNHEWGVLGLTKLDYFNADAAAAVRWTTGVLDEKDRGYLKGLPLTHVSGKVTIVHGSLENPEEFNYIFTPADAGDSIIMMKTPICFVGHSHAPGIFRKRKGGTVEIFIGSKVDIEDGAHYLVNAGSVGQPRDGDPRASYVIYDETNGTVEIRRTVYDIETARKKIIAAGLPASLADRLREGS